MSKKRSTKAKLCVDRRFNIFLRITQSSKFPFPFPCILISHKLVILLTIELVLENPLPLMLENPIQAKLVSPYTDLLDFLPCRNFEATLRIYEFAFIFEKFP